MDPDLFRAATRRAHAAGFDGVKLHMGNGYLPLKSLSPNSPFAMTITTPTPSIAFGALTEVQFFDYSRASVPFSS